MQVFVTAANICRSAITRLPGFRFATLALSRRDFRIRRLTVDRDDRKIQDKDFVSLGAQDMGDILRQLERKIKMYRSKLADLEVAVRVIRRELEGDAIPDQLPSGDIPSFAAKDPTPGELSGLRIVEAAKRILADQAGGWMDYKDVVKEARRRGFQNRSKSDKNLRDSFHHTMHRHEGIFEWQGTKVKLKQQAAN